MKKYAVGFLPRLVVVALIVLASTLPVVTAEKPTCREFDSGKDLMRVANTSDVFVMVTEEGENPGEVDSKEWKNVCEGYKATSSQRLKGLVMGHVFGKKHRNIAKKLGVEDDDEWPTFVMVKKGTKGKELPEKGIKFTGESKEGKDLIDFIMDTTPSKFGQYVFSIHPYDDLAARLMGVKDDDKYADLQKKFYYYCSIVLIKLLSFHAKDSDMRMVCATYAKTFQKIFEQGKEYPETQTKRLEKLIDDDNMSAFKREEMHQKIHVYSKFTDPMELTYDDHKAFILLWGSQIFLLVLFAIMIFDLLTGGRSEEEREIEKETESEETKKDEDKKEE